MMIFTSTFMYSACKLVGPEEWPAQVKWELEHLDASIWPAFRAIGQLARLTNERQENLEVHVDAGTYITRARSFAAGLFLRSKADLWVTFDDDNYVDVDVLRRLCAAARSTRGMVSAPYLNRDGRTMTFECVTGPTLHEIIGSGIAVNPATDVIPLRRVNRIGLGVTAIHRRVIETVARTVQQWKDVKTGLESPALFVESIQDGKWIGEDYSFCDRVRACELPCMVLLDAPCDHAGRLAKLSVDGEIMVAKDSVAAELAEGIRDYTDRVRKQAEEKALLASGCNSSTSQGE
jgi:hypothetical protein